MVFINVFVFIEMQVDFVVDFVKRLCDEGVQCIDVKKEVEDVWYKIVQDISNVIFFIKVVLWYMGLNIFGKKREQLNYIGGIKCYMDVCIEGIKDWFNFDIKFLLKQEMFIVR